MKYILLSVILVYSTLASAQKSKSELETALRNYRENLSLLRLRNTNSYDLPDIRFFLFGMGDRTKFIYKEGKLTEAMTGKLRYNWNVKSELIVPNEYTVYLETTNGQTIVIFENAQGLYLKAGNTVTALSESKLNLPEFTGKKFAPVLKVLHHEIIININKGRPLPNYLVYHNPWHRDAALMAMALKETNNLGLIKNWVLGLTNPYDYNNKGISEADNPGEVLYMLSLFTDKNSLLVKAALDSTKKLVVGDHIEGQTDFGKRYVFQTKWIKYGLKSLGLPDPYTIPKNVEDNYSALFWWDYKDQHVYKGRFNLVDSKDYPYLTWAEDNFYGEKRGYVGNRDYPLSWEKNACCANYGTLWQINPVYVQLQLATPHTWHATEMFLLLINEK